MFDSYVLGEREREREREQVCMHVCVCVCVCVRVRVRACVFVCEHKIFDADKVRHLVEIVTNLKLRHWSNIQASAKLSYFISLSHTHTRSHTHTHSLSISHIHTLTHTLYLSHTYTHSHTLSLYLTHTHTLSLYLSLTHTHTFIASTTILLMPTQWHSERFCQGEVVACLSEPQQGFCYRPQTLKFQSRTLSLPD